MFAGKQPVGMLMAATVLFFCFFASPAAMAGGNEYDAVCDHLKKQYKAKKVKIPFLWLARAVVGIVRPAGVKSFKVTIFRDLQFSRDTLDEEMQSVMRDSFGSEWSPILRIRSRAGEQMYMNMRESGKNVKILLVTIENREATVIRAKFNPDKLARFIENPRIFGISLNGREKPPPLETNRPEIIEPDKDIAITEKIELRKTY